MALAAAAWWPAALVAADNSATANAATPSRAYLFQAFGMEQGLPGTSVLAVLQSRDGYLWIGTPEGLARFDGVRFVLFRRSNTPAFHSQAIHCLYEDRAGTLWIGTDRGVVCERDGRFERSGRGDTMVTAFAEDRAGTMWVGTYGNGLYSCRDGRWERHGDVVSLAGRFVRCLYVDSSDRLWVGFERHNGVVFRDAGGFHVFAAGGALQDRVQCITEQPRGTLWFGTRDHGLLRYRGDVLRRFTTADGLANAQVFDVQAARDGGLWVLAESLQRIDDPANPVFSTITRGADDHFMTMAEDAEGSAWLGTPNDGLIQMRPRPYRVVTDDPSRPGRQVRSVTEDGAGNIWFVVQGHGVARVSPSGEVQTGLERLLPGSAPKAVCAGPDGTVWMVDGALHAWRNDGWVTPWKSSTEVYDFFADRSGWAWVTQTGAGIGRLSDGQFQPMHLPSRTRIPGTASSFAQAPDGTRYFGLWQDGLVRVDAGGITRFDGSRGMPGNEVRAVYAETNDRVWVGLKNNGLVLIDHDICLHSPALSDVLTDNVRAILADDDGRLWFGTSAGVMWAKKDELVAALRGERPVGTVHVGSIEDGAHISPVYSGRQPVAWKTHDGRLLFAGRDGVIVVDPRHLPANSVAPPVHIERVLLDRREATPGAAIDVMAGVREVAIEYSAPSFVQPSRVLFKYKLEGYDPAWIDAGTRRAAFYSNLPPGRYVFRVRACNSAGVWNALGDHLEIVQRPYFYQTVWFYAAALAGALLAALGLHRWRTVQLRRENERLERGIAERTHQLELAHEVILERTRQLELANDAKTEFLESVSHEIRNPLGGLNGLLGLLQREPLGAATRELARSIQACASSLNRAFEEVLGHARLEHGGFAPQSVSFSLRDGLEELVASFAWQAEQQRNRIALQFAPDFADGFVGDAAAITTIAANFLSNAIKYAPGSPIELVVETHPRADEQIDVCLEVRDHGPGIPPEEQELIFKKFVRGSKARRDGVAGTGLGLATCRVMAQAIAGHVGVESRPGEGSAFHLWVPLRRASAAASDPPPAPVAATVSDPVRSSDSPGAASVSKPTASLPASPVAARVSEPTALSPAPSGAASVSEPTPAAAAVAPSLAGSRLLVVDDQRYNRLLLQDVARELGCVCEVAGNAEEALRLAGASRFDIILLDWDLPDRNGGTVARSIRARPDGQHPIIIATTAYESGATRQACLESGMEAFLLRPFTAAQVHAQIVAVRARRNNGGPVPGAGAVDALPPRPQETNGRPNFSALGLGPGAAGAKATPAEYLRSLDEAVARLETALRVDDKPGVAGAAHRLLGLAGLVGARALSAATSDLDRLVQQGRTGEHAAFQAVLAAVDQIKRELGRNAES